MTDQLEGVRDHYRATGLTARLKSALHAPEAFDLLEPRPEFSGDSGKICGAERGGFHVDGTDDRLIEDVRLELHEEVVDGSAAINAKLPYFFARIGFHGVDQITALVSDAFESGADDLGFAGGASESGEHAARGSVPVRRAQADESRDEVNAGGIGNTGGDGFGFGGGGDEAERVAQPLDGGAGDEDAAFGGELRGIVERSGAGGEQVVI